MRIRQSFKKLLPKLIDAVYYRFRKTKAVMIHPGRSGSSVLGFMLNDHPNIYWAGEILKQENVAKYKRRSAKFDYKNVISSQEYRSFRKCHGFEMKYMHMRALGISKEQFLATVDDLGYSHFILLSRKNFLRNAISSRVAAETGLYHLRTDKPTELIQVTLNTDQLVIKFDKHAVDLAAMQKLLEHKRLLALSYEEDVEQDPMIAYRKICTFLQVPFHSVAIKLKRINPYPLNKMLLNFDDVAATLKGTQYEWMLEL